MSNDDRTEDLLRRVLSVEADQVRPAGDGLSRIQQRVDARYSRLRWMRPVLAATAALVVAGGAVGGYAIASHGGGNQTVKYTHTAPPTPTSVPVDSNGYPTDAIFPFTTATQEQSWEQQFAGGHTPWPSDPAAVTQSWIESYLKEPGHFTYTADTQTDTSDVTVSRNVEGNPHAVTVVHLAKYGHAWLVTGASDPAGDLFISSPAEGAAVTSPLTVTGPGYGVDEVATIAVHDATTPELFGSANASFGNGMPQWSATVPFTATSDAGAVVATVLSAADGGLATLTAEKVTFGSSGGRAVSAGAAYGIEGGSLVKLDPTTGASEGPVHGVTGTVYEVRQYGDSLYYTVRVGDCIPTLYAIPTSGGTPTAVATADADYGIVGFDVSAQGRLVYLESSGCNQSRAGMAKLVFPTWAHGPQGRAIDFPSMPPAITGDPVWESDNVHVDAFVHTGMEGYLARYDSAQGDSPTPSANACSGYDINNGMPNALTTSADGTLWFATQTGSSMQVISCTSGTPTVEFTVNGNNEPTSLSVNSQGQVLVADANGHVYSWNGSGAATQLPQASGVSSVAW